MLFGPTSDLFYGYAENENVRSNVCEEPCEWENAKWNTWCKKIKNENSKISICMKQISDMQLWIKIKMYLKE